MTGWEWTTTPQELPAPVVPVVRSRTGHGPCTAHARASSRPHLPILDRINYTILNRLEIATLQAFRQRAIKGVPDKDAEGNEIDYDDIFSADPGALWQLPAPPRCGSRARSTSARSARRSATTSRTSPPSPAPRSST
jgi:hypothetical protein